MNGTVSLTRERTVALRHPWWAPWRRRTQGVTTTRNDVLASVEYNMKGQLRVENMAHHKRIGCINVVLLDERSPILSCSAEVRAGDVFSAHFSAYPN